MKAFKFNREGLEKAIKHKPSNRKYLLIAVGVGVIGIVLYNPTAVVAFKPI